MELIRKSSAITPVVHFSSLAIQYAQLASHLSASAIFTSPATLTKTLSSPLFEDSVE